MGLSQNLIDTLYRNTHEHIFNNGETAEEQADALREIYHLGRTKTEKGQDVEKDRDIDRGPTHGM